MHLAFRNRARRLSLGLLLASLLGGCIAGGPRVPGEVESMSGMADLSRIRTQNGLSAMTSDAALEKAAADQAGYMAGADRMVHTTGWGRDFKSRMHARGIRGAAAENIAHAAEVDTVFALWAASPPHRRNMLDPRFSRFGLASARDGGGKRYWALVLGR